MKSLVEYLPIMLHKLNDKTWEDTERNASCVKTNKEGRRFCLHARLETFWEQQTGLKEGVIRKDGENFEVLKKAL